MEDRMILGKNLYSSFNSFDTHLNNMTMVIGSSGSGKTERVVKPQILNTFENNLIISLSKTEDIAVYEKLLKSRHYNVYKLDFTDPSNSNVGFDPLNFLKTEKDIKNFANMLVNLQGTFNRDPYWSDSSIQVITALLSLLFENYIVGLEKKRPTLKHFYELYNELRLDYDPKTSLASTSLDDYFDKIYLYNPDSLAFRAWRSIKGLAAKTSSCIYSTVNNIIESIFDDSVIKISSISPSLKLDMLTKEKSALFLITSPTEKFTNRFVDIFYSILFSKLFETANKSPFKKKIHIICDDFACTSKIKDFENYISIFRSMGISITIILQSLSQLQIMYGLNESSIITDNCDRMIYLGSSDLSTCRTVSAKTNKPVFDILHMPLNYSYVFERGKKPVFVEKYDTYNDQNYIKFFVQV